MQDEPKITPSADPQGSQLVPTSPEAETIEEGLLARFVSPRCEAVTSLDLDTDDGKGAYLRCIQRADQGANDAVGKTLRVKDYLVHVIELADMATGEVSPTRRLVLVLADGTTVGTCGVALVKSWAHVRQLYGLGPYDPPLDVELELVQGRNKFRYLQIKKISRTRQAKPKAADKTN